MSTVSKRSVGVALAGALAVLAGGPRGEAAPAVAFCDGPAWCDPIHGGLQQSGSADVVHPAAPGTVVRAIPVHVRNAGPVPGVLGVGIDAQRQVFFSTLKGGPVPAGESVGYVQSKSLGAVTRDAASAMAHGVPIDDPALNGKPNAVVVAARAATPGSSTSAIGSWYDGQRWWLYNEDGAPMAAGETFFYAEGTAFGGQAVHAAANDYQGIGVYLDDARINGNPAAVVVPLHAFGGAYNASPLGVWYDAGAGQWVVYNESGSALAFGESIHYVTVP